MKKPSLFVRIKEMFNKKERSNEERFADVDNAVLLLSDHLKEITENLTSLQTAHTALQEQFTEITKENAVITEKLSTIENQPSQNFTPRPKNDWRRIRKY
ncbi:Phage capsid scaffolding protein (GPO) serine peptidase [Pasteurella bettyae]|nr:Phage capsid scaffolding protein (GPO) serine peptidase [Pasteurella bettyae]